MVVDHFTGIICGLHRSGTTYIGKILKYAPDTRVLQEPFNYKYGIEGVPSWYPYISQSDPDPKVSKLIDILTRLEGRWSEPEGGEGWRRNIARLIGNRQQRRWRLLKVKRVMKNLPRNIIWKDPFCTFMVDYLTRENNFPVVCMIKHPCAFYYSVKKQNWQFDVDHLLRQSALIQRFGSDVSGDVWQLASENNLLSLSLQWKLMARVVSHSRHQNKKLLLVRHEDFCNAPEIWIEKICNHLNIPLTQKMLNYVSKTTRGSVVEGPPGVAELYERDSNSLQHIWKKNLSVLDQREVLDVVGKDLQLFYGSN